MFGIKTVVSPGHGFTEKSNSIPDIGGGGKKGFQTAEFIVAGLKTPAEVMKITFKESTVDAQAASVEFFVFSFHYKRIRARAHKREHFFGGFQDQIPAAPGYG